VELLLPARMEHEAWAVQLEPVLVSQQSAALQLLSLRRLAQVLAELQLARRRELPESARQQAQVLLALAARRSQELRRQVRALRRVQLLPSQLFLKSRRLRRQLRLALIV
jgi:hypothetical protein